MRKRTQLGIAIVALALLAVPSTFPFMALFVRVSLMNVACTYLISLFISFEVPLRYRLGAAYLTLVGITYLIPAVLGLDSSMQLVEDNLWNSLISPYLLFSIYHARYLQPNFEPARRAYYFVPQDGHLLLSSLAICFSVAAIGGAVLIAKGERTGVRIWALLLVVLTVIFFGYLYVAAVSWGITEIRAQILWEASYIAAFLLVSVGKMTSSPVVISKLEEW